MVGVIMVYGCQCSNNLLCSNGKIALSRFILFLMCSLLWLVACIPIQLMNVLT